jgi:hypothetical protein
MFYTEEQIKSFTSFTPREKSMLEQVLGEVDKIISVAEARRLLDSKNTIDIQFANPDLRPVAFAFREVTKETSRRGLVAELSAWLLFILSLPLILIAAGLSGGAGPHTNKMIKDAFLQLRLNKRLAIAISRDVIKELRNDIRAPILFLRSFSSQNSNSIEAGDLRTAEERLADSYQRHGPVIAVGHPEEEISMLGPLRLYFDNDTWQAGVLYLMSVSQLVIIQVGISHGTLWELALAKRLLKPERLIIYLADPVEPGRIDDKYYLMFKKYLEEIVGWKLPNEVGMYIGFGEGWEPRFYSSGGELLSRISSTKK